LHGHQEGRFFHGYYDCYCYLPLYVLCGRHLLAAKLRRSNIDGSAGSIEELERIMRQIRARWPKVRILLRADSGFARDELIGEPRRLPVWLGKNERLIAKIKPELAKAARKSRHTRRPAATSRSSCGRRWTAGAAVAGS
jgi:Transposase DDE domain group 1